MNRQVSSKNAVRVLGALLVLIAAISALAGPVDSAQAQTPVQQAAGGVTDTWSVQVTPGTDPDQLALQMGAQNLGQIGSLTNYYLFHIPGTDSQLTAMADVFAANSQVVSFEQQVARQQSKRWVVEDPLYLDQWHLTSINVEGAWNLGFTGAGVTIAIVDDGLEYVHPDIGFNYKPLSSWDFTTYSVDGGDSDPAPLVETDKHGTPVAGVAAADNDGLTCGAGVAFDAGLSGIRLVSLPSTDAQEAAALNFRMNPASPGADFNSIYNNSWGPIDGPDIDGNWQLASPGPRTLEALQNGVTYGRNRKGSIYVWSAGNGRTNSDNVNYDGYANSRYTIAVGAVDRDDKQAPYSEPGAAMLVTAPSGNDSADPTYGIVTTDLLGHWGYSFNTDCTEGNFGRTATGGTSASAPIVSGVVALMLQANPNLGWRDVQNILARTADVIDATDADWDANPNILGVQNNGDDLHVNHKYGFGKVNAAAAVDMADPATYVNLKRDASFSSGIIIPDVDNRNIPDNVFIDGAYEGVNSTFDMTHDMTVEHVEVVFHSSEDLNQPPPGTGGYRGDLRLVLTSPSGTVSVLSEPHSDNAPDYTGWKFMTVRNWGEPSRGTWTLRVTDEKGGGVSVFDSWQLILHGTGLTADIDVTIGGDLKGTYALFAGDSTRQNYAGVDSGPVKVESINGLPITAAIREAWLNNGVVTSFFQLMGLPQEQLSDTYVYPGYNNVTLNEQMRISNVDTVESTVTVTIGGVEQGTYTLYPPGSPLGPSAVRVNYAGVDSGPVVVQGTTGVNIISSIREAWAVNGVIKSFVQLMGLPASQLSDKYVFPGYNNVTLNEQLRIGNVDTVPSTVTVMIGGILRGTYTLQPSKAVRVNYAGVDGGPVVVQGTTGVNIISSIREAWAVNGVITSFAQLMGLPASQLADEYVFPAYNNVTLNEQMRVGNVDTVPSTVKVTIGGILRGTYTLQPNQAVRVNYAGVDSGPVVVQGTTGVNIISSIREAWAVNGVITSFTQIMGLPIGQLSTAYLFPAYNNVTLNEQLRFGVP